MTKAEKKEYAFLKSEKISPFSCETARKGASKLFCTSMDIARSEQESMEEVVEVRPGRPQSIVGVSATLN